MGLKLVIANTEKLLGQGYSMFKIHHSHFRLKYFCWNSMESFEFPQVLCFENWISVNLLLRGFQIHQNQSF